MNFAVSTVQASPAPTAPRRGVRIPIGKSKVCTKCLQEKDLSEYAVKRGGYAAVCRGCQSQLGKAHYALKKTNYVESAGVRNKAQRTLLRGIRDKFLEDKCCQHCGTNARLTVSPKDLRAHKPSHEIIAAACSEALLVESLKNSFVLCRPHMSKHHAGVDMLQGTHSPNHAHS